MTSWMKKSLIVICIIAGIPSVFYGRADAAMRFVNIKAKNKIERSAIANMGVSIEAVRSTDVWGFANESSLERLKNAGLKILGDFDISVARGGHQNNFGFPPKDSSYHTYDELTAALNDLQAKNADIAKVTSIGDTIENRKIWAIHINTNPSALISGRSNKPGAIFMGNHHAREHLSIEVPLMLAQYLLNHRDDAKIWALIDSRDIWIIPIVNPDGSEWDISTGQYVYWRKNRRDNRDGTFGVDLNRNYGFKWGTGGSSEDTSSDVYMGVAPFSEPESSAIRDFVRLHTNAKILLSFHTFSELILYPWGHTYDKVENTKDLAVYEEMAKTMAAWNHYTPEQSSDLYIASGDTTDWAYGELGMFSFTFELSPSSMFNGGFYPGPDAIDKAFADNLRPCLYMIDLADDPYRTVSGGTTRWLPNYVEPSLAPQHFWGW
ncbi:MAG: M14 family metallopeptidase [Bdellovibrionota bacterium]